MYAQESICIQHNRDNGMKLILSLDKIGCLLYAKKEHEHYSE